MDPVKAFARWVIENSAWQGTSLDGGDVQDKAVELGLLRETKFDPAIHGPNKMSEFRVDLGDPWFEFTNRIA